MQDVVAMLSDAMDMVADTRETTTLELALFVFHKLFETVPSQLFILYVVAFMLFCNNIYYIKLFVFLIRKKSQILCANCYPCQLYF